MRTNVVPFSVIAACLLGAGTAGRITRPAAGDALAAAALAAHFGKPAPGLLVVVDPDCPACEDAMLDLQAEVRPGELGLEVRILEAGGDGRPLLEAAGPGLIPLLLVVDAAGRPVAMIRGPRPPAMLRAWLEEATARALAKPP
jgi:hypothetical protein